jgi:hypothetical protein
VASIDDVLPHFDVHEVHSMALRLSPGDAVALALETPVAGDPIVRAPDFRADGERLTTETRIAAVAAAAVARRSFLRYWRFVGPFSALIRRRWLAQIAKRAA